MDPDVLGSDISLRRPTNAQIPLAQRRERFTTSSGIELPNDFNPRNTKAVEYQEELKRCYPPAARIVSYALAEAEALVMADLPAVIFALCVLGVRDMRFLWTELDKIARKHGVHCAGDTACGFGNTAMVLAEFAAVLGVTVSPEDAAGPR